MPFELTPERLLTLLIAGGVILLVGFPVHEFSHALVAFRLGDSTARFMGRLTLNPAAHFDPLGGLMLALSLLLGGFAIGWAKPTPVNPVNLAGGRRGEAFVAAAGPVSNLVMAALFAIPLRAVIATGLVGEVPGLFLDVLASLVVINVALFLFNLLPIPPLDGYKVLLAFLDPRTAWQIRPYEQYGFLLLLVLLFSGIFGRVLVPLLRFLTDLLVGVPLI